jgi:hypothetical protein
MALVRPTLNLDDLLRDAPARLLTFAALLDAGGDVAPLLERWIKLETLQRQVEAAQPVTTAGAALEGWGAGGWAAA